MRFLNRRYGPLTGLGWVMAGSGAAVVGGAVGGGSVLVLLVGAAAGSRPPATPAGPPPPAVEVDAATLHADYAADGAAAAAKYAGRTLALSITPDGVSQFGDWLTIRQRVKGFDSVYADVPVLSADRVSVGKTVVVVGTVRSTGGGDVQLGRCRVR